MNPSSGLAHDFRVLWERLQPRQVLRFNTGFVAAEAAPTALSMGTNQGQTRKRGQSNLAFEIFAARAATLHRPPNISNARLLWPLFPGSGSGR
jgi:hypothetical protein